MNIQKIEEIVPLGPSESMVDYKVQRLTAAGENYGSLMLQIDFIIKSPNGTKTIHSVAKTVPPNELIQKIFNTPESFKNEIAFYKKVVPTLEKFEQDQEISTTGIANLFPKYYTSRINLNNSTDNKVDSDAILLLENLKFENFATVERTQGFNLQVSQVIVKHLAYFHALSLGLKLKQPQIFHEKIQKYLAPSIPDKDVRIIETLAKLIEETPGCSLYVQKARQILMKMLEPAPPPREPFATFTHDDFWVNNILFKQSTNEVKFIDFQRPRYASPVRDLIFFLFTSVENHVLESSCDDLLQLYYENFVSVLQRELKCDDIEFTIETFQQELKLEARNTQFGHIVFMLNPIFAPKGSVKELEEMTVEDFLKSLEGGSDLHKAKLELVVGEFARRDWI
ncbi:uncharacterized protein LOC655205 [Tribolium castaneum]|uniref:uncharacterized protein LOC655205 n=1 Tax=Tribolium castaneum TaxID=7070 RepID=UPI0000D5640E|nr:PREDICTED: uncharacterized protein LOC655205 [Tribolium castaneum]|eukprot:XP_966814.1 PREDICTED: uncharacterized protein LOC655205 [Tribolium castaneum]